MADQRPPDVPKELRGMIQLNVAYSVLICPHEQCRKAVQPSAFTRHSHREHQTTFSARQELQKFIDKLGWKYDSRTVQFPPDGSKPQPTIPVDDGIECRLCAAESRPFKTGSQKSMKKSMKVHGNKVHKRIRVADGELYRVVRVQTWFRGGGEARYWRVEENDDGTRETPVVHGRTEAVETIHGEGDGVVDDAVITVASADESVDTPKEDAPAAVIVIGSDDEVLVPRGKGPIPVVEVDSSDELVGALKEEATAAAIAIDSDDEVLVPRSIRPIPVVEVGIRDESNRDADYIPSSEEVSSDEEGGSSTVESEASDAENSEACQPTAGERTVVITPRPRKRKVQSASTAGIGSDDDTYQPSSPRSGWQNRKRQQRMSPFVDSGVVMPPSSESKVQPPDSPDDRMVPRSSPPSVDWVVPSQPEGEERLQGAGRAADGATDAADEDPESQDPSPARFIFGRRQPTLDALRERLGAWCQACPACVMMGTEVGRVMHDVGECWRKDTVDIAAKTRVMQRHIEAHGGFGGREGCPRCGVPRTVCQRWQARPGGSGWEGVAGRACQYEGRLTAAVITMLMDGCHEGWAVAEEWMSRAGVAPTKQDEVFEWFRGPAWWADPAMEVSRMVRVFHMLAGKNGRVVRR
jgi:hypothetical protein